MKRFIITADTGSGKIYQQKVATSMEILSTNHNIQSVFLLGDNIYPGGCKDIHDEQFKTKFEDIYHLINLPFYLCLGNHDYGLSYNFKDPSRNNSLAQIEYSKHSTKWNMPSKYYNVVQPPCEYFMIDTNFDVLSESVIQKQLASVQSMIQQSKQPWKILCGHHTFRSVGGHGNADQRFEQFMIDLLKPRNCHIDFYMCGHDHCKSIIKTSINHKPFTCLVIGTGGKEYEKLFSLKKLEKAPTKSELLFYSPNLGVCFVEATQKEIKLICLNEELQEEYRYIQTK